MGGGYWAGTIAALTVHGHRVFAPTLGDEHITNLTGHIIQISTLINHYDLQDIILVGHSYGGMIITGVAAGMPERIHRMIYLDAALPDPGQSLFDLFTSAGSNPQSFVGLEPAMAYVEKIQFDPAMIERLSKTYIRCTKSEFCDLTRLSKKKIDAAPGGWTYLELPSSHVPMADMPDEFHKILLDAARF